MTAPVDMLAGTTPGPWDIFVCDDGGDWSGWPLSIGSKDAKTIVRQGGFYPYEWDELVSRPEALANARLIAAAPQLAADVARLESENGRLREALEEAAADLAGTVRSLAGLRRDRAIPAIEHVDHAVNSRNRVLASLEVQS